MININEDINTDLKTKTMDLKILIQNKIFQIEIFHCNENLFILIKIFINC